MLKDKIETRLAFEQPFPSWRDLRTPCDVLLAIREHLHKLHAALLRPLAVLDQERPFFLRATLCSTPNHSQHPRIINFRRNYAKTIVRSAHTTLKLRNTDHKNRKYRTNNQV